MLTRLLLCLHAPLIFISVRIAILCEMSNDGWFAMFIVATGLSRRC